MVGRAITLGHVDARLPVVELHGEHDAHSAEPLRALLGELIGNGTSVLVDLHEATFVDSTIVGVIIEAHKKAQQTGHCVVVVLDDSSGSEVHRLFRLTRLDVVLPVTATREEGVAAATATPT
jgi:anti-anti-sigma factor